MLGWNPADPASGGLGKVSQHLAEALASKVEVISLTPVTAAGKPASELRFREYFKHASDPSYRMDQALDPYYRFPDQAIFYREYSLAIEANENSAPPRLSAKDQQQLELLHQFTENTIAEARKTEFDVIHAHDWMTVPAAMVIKEETGKPLIFHVHSTEKEREPEKLSQGLSGKWEQKGIEVADKVITVSKTTSLQLNKLYALPVEQTDTVYHGIDLKIQLRKEIDPQAPVILFAGRLTSQKGVRYLIETASLLLKSIPKAHFLVAGDGEEMRPAMMQARQKGISDKFTFTGFLNSQRMEEAFARADVFFLPSVAEPFGYAALEAVSRKIPVVTSKDAGINEVVKHILSANYDDSVRMANYLFALINYPGLRDKLTRGAWNDIRNLSWENAAEKVYQHYETLIAEK